VAKAFNSSLVLFVKKNSSLVLVCIVCSWLV